MRLRYHTLDVFTDRPFGGNPLAVFPDARGLPGAWMQRIARELNLSETVFVLPPEAGGTRRARIFTPGVELPFAGHPTVGTALLLAWLGEVDAAGGETEIVLEEGVGPVPVRIRAEGGRAVFAQLAAAQRPEVGPPPPSPEALAAVLGVKEDEIGSGDRAPAAVSCGVGFTIVPVRDREVLGRVRLSPAEWERTLANGWAPHVYAAAPHEGDARRFQVRMFAPAMGIPEDPATGAAACAFAGYLAMREGSDGSLAWTVDQGIEMGRPSVLHLEADVAGGQVTAVRVGGGAAPVSEGWMEVPVEEENAA